MRGDMTAIVGLADESKVWIGGDSAGVAGLSLTVRADEKVFRRGEWVFGFTGSFRAGQLLRYSLNVPEPRGDLAKFLATEFIDAVRYCLKGGGVARKKNNIKNK